MMPRLKNSSPKILIADDSDEQADQISEFLTGGLLEEVEICHVQNSREARKKLSEALASKQPYTLLMTDLRLRELTNTEGIELLEFIHKPEFAGRIKAIIYSAINPELIVADRLRQFNDALLGTCNVDELKSCHGRFHYWRDIINDYLFVKNRVQKHHSLLDLVILEVLIFSPLIAAILLLDDEPAFAGVPKVSLVLVFVFFGAIVPIGHRFGWPLIDSAFSRVERFRGIFHKAIKTLYSKPDGGS